MMKAFFSSLLALVFLVPQASAQGLPGLTPPGSPFDFEPEKQGHTTLALASSHRSLAPGGKGTFAVQLTMAPGWHTYWDVPGDSGMATSFEWSAPPAVRIGNPLWPTPTQFTEEGLVSFGYKGQATVLIPFEVASDAPPGEIEISLKAEWLECKTACLPGDGEAQISLNIGDTLVNSSVEAAVTAARDHLPQSATGWQVSTLRTGNRLAITLTPPSTTSTPTAFYPRDELVWKLGEGFSFETIDNSHVITGSLQDDANVPDRMQGVVRFDTFTLSLDDAGAPTPAGPAEVLIPQEQEEQGLPVILGLAFLGGIILNLMPCVFPVIGLKISGFVHQAQGDHKKARMHGLVFALGIILSMWVLAIIVSSLNLAWGQQFQTAGMNIAIAMLFFALALNLFGVFEMGTRLTSVGGDLQQKSGYAGSFYSGLLVTIAATPCTGPMMGSALGWAAGKPTSMVFLLFTVLGLGMALPYVLLSSRPKLMEKMPAPGAWMETFKQSMGFLLMAFVVIWFKVLIEQVAPDHLWQLIAALFLVAVAAWIYGKWCAPHRSAGCRILSGTLALILALGAVNYAYDYTPPAADVTPELQAHIDAGKPLVADDLTPELAAQLTEAGHTIHWQAWSPQAVAEAQAAGKRVFVDFTATWCLTCQVNKKTTLRKDAVMKAFEDANTITLVADWTNRDDIIRETIRSLGRNGVPVYTLYEPDSAKPALLPESLTPGLVKDALQNRQ